MADSKVQQNLLPSEPEIKDLLNLYRKDLFLNLNCHHIAQIQSFDPVKQIASAVVVYKKTFFNKNGVTGNYDPVLIDYPVLLDCPVICLGGGNGALTFPIEKGDECVVLFNDRDIDNWFQGSSGGAVATPRLHSFSDGLIIVGLRSLANALPNYSTDRTELRNKDGVNRVSLGTDDIKILVGDELTVTFRAAGGVVIENSTGNFTFENNADVSFDTGTVQGLFGNGGKVKFQNAMGDLVTAIYNILTTATAGGFPLIISPTDAATLLSFVP